MNSMRAQEVCLKGNLSLLSEVYNEIANPSSRRLETQHAVCALIFAFDSVGKSKLARIAMMAITTSSSMSVKPGLAFDPSRTLFMFIFHLVSVQSSGKVTGNVNNVLPASFCRHHDCQRHFDPPAACSAASISAQDGARQRVNTSCMLRAPSTLPSGEKATMSIRDPWHSKLKSCSWLSKSQILMGSLTLLAVASRFMSGEKTADQTPEGNPLNVAICFGVAASQSSTSLDQPARAKNLLSGEKATPSYQRRLRFVVRPVFRSVSEVTDLVSGFKMEVRYAVPSGEIAPLYHPGSPSSAG